MKNNIYKYQYITCLILLCTLSVQSRGKCVRNIKQPYIDTIELNNNAETKAVCSGVYLTGEELVLDQKLAELKQGFVKSLKSAGILFENQPFHILKPLIDTSRIFQVISQMPKGGLLHSHSGGLTNIKWLIHKAAEYDNCYVYCNKDNDKYLYGQLGIYKQNETPEGFVLLKEKIKSNKEFANTLYQLLVIEKKSNTECIEYWTAFENCFGRIWQLISYRPFFKEYYRKAFKDLADNKVTHLEVRFIFDPIFDLEYGKYPVAAIVEDLQQIIAEMEDENINFSLKLIYSGFKFNSITEVNAQLTEAFELKVQFPDMISGFDLVAEEDKWNSLNYYQSCFNSLDSMEVKYNTDMPLFLHAGESHKISNVNVIEAINLDSKRIGHGLNMVLFPGLMEQVIEKDILVELNPLSNKILGYTNDLRNHPGRIFMSHGVQCSISSDDPGVFAYDGMNYDYIMAIIAWDLDIKAIKKLVFNSIQYSSLDQMSKEKNLKELDKQWLVFVNDILKSY